MVLSTPMSNQEQYDKEDKEISLLDLFAVIFKYKKMILITTFCAAVFIVVYSVIAVMMPPEKSFSPNIYTSKALMLIKNPASSSGSLSSRLESDGLSGMASLMGLNGSAGQSYSKLAAFLATTDSLHDAINTEFHIAEKNKITKKPKTAARKIISKSLNAAFDEKTGVFKISYDDIDPEFAKNVVSFCLKYYNDKFMELGLDTDRIEKENLETSISSCLDGMRTIRDKIKQLEEGAMRGYAGTISEIAMEAEYLKTELDAQKAVYTQLKAKYELVKIKISSENPVLQILEYPEAPEVKSKPRRGLTCIIVTAAAFFLSVFMAFLLNGIKNEPGISEKFKRNGK